jgi:hypothetical protein
MSAAGNCYDNAVAESFFATLKKELVHGCAFETRSEAYDAISDYIENYYNPKRRHSAVGNVSPITFELATAPRIAASSHQPSVRKIRGSPANELSSGTPTSSGRGRRSQSNACTML